MMFKHKPMLTVAGVGMAVLTLGASDVLGQVRVASYNIGENNAPITDYAVNTYFNNIFQSIGNESVNGIAKRLDVIGLQEVGIAAQDTNVEQRLAARMNTLYGVSSYQSVVADYGDGHITQAFVYDSSTVTLVGVQTVSIGTRPALVAQFKPVGYTSNDASFYVYNVHLKAFDGYQTTRNAEAQAVRAHSNNSIPANANIIYMGDMNLISGANEGAYQRFLAAGNGQAFDPRNGTFAQNINQTTNWSDYIAALNQATYNSRGLSSRLDMQLPSTELGDSEGLDLIAGSYHPYGIKPGYPGTAPSVTDSNVRSASDHVPLVADYQVPAKMEVTADSAPTRVIKGANVNLNVNVRNSANVIAANGADELDYTLTANGAASGGGSGTVLALSSGNTHVVALDTGTVGNKNGGIHVTTSSQAAENPNVDQAVAYQVLDHAKASFDSAQEVTAIQVDFGMVDLGSGTIGQQLMIFNLLSSEGLTAGLDLDSIDASGDTGVLALSGLSLFDALAGGDSAAFSVNLLTDAAGTFSATYVLHFSDEDLPGASSLGDLTILVRADVVPEPAALCVLGVGSVAMFLRRRERSC